MKKFSRLPAIDPAEFPDITSALARTEESRGFVSNLMRMTSHAPGAQKARVPYGHFLRFETDLTELQRELVICATVREVPYGWAHHVGLILQLGFSEEQAAVLKTGAVSTGLSEADRALCEFTFAYAACRGVSDSILKDLQGHFSARQIIEIALLSGSYLGAGAMLTAFEPELEPPEVLQLELDWQTRRLEGEKAKQPSS
ncbi:4-carboxymuconolactone decarboxylase [Hyphomicrobiales bacterium]|nr:4-carboxymuconolactone decarboxylase [Hyphomicrobiales bacterium]CAH1692850.1 4-carboxymuconolactone decarboxylase [Hyphomicrobiales bacterium]